MPGPRAPEGPLGGLVEGRMKAAATLQPLACARACMRSVVSSTTSKFDCTLHA